MRVSSIEVLRYRGRAQLPYNIYFHLPIHGSYVWRRADTLGGGGVSSALSGFAWGLPFKFYSPKDAIFGTGSIHSHTLSNLQDSRRCVYRPIYE